jgi:hypothetical protein
VGKSRELKNAESTKVSWRQISGMFGRHFQITK